MANVRHNNVCCCAIEIPLKNPRRIHKQWNFISFGKHFLFYNLHFIRPILIKSFIFLSLPFYIVLSLLLLPMCGCCTVYVLFIRAKNVSLLFASTSICMSIEMISSVAHSTAKMPVISPFAFIEVLVALQGVLVFILFVCLPKPMRAVRRWWIESGSLDLRESTELELLNGKELTN